MLRFIGKVPDLGRIVYDDYDDTIGFCNPRKYNRFLRGILDIVDDTLIDEDIITMYNMLGYKFSDDGFILSEVPDTDVMEIPYFVNLFDYSMRLNPSGNAMIPYSLFYNREGEIIIRGGKRFVYAHNLFSNCRNIIRIDLSQSKMNRLISIGSMFRDCINLEEIDMRNLTFKNCRGLQDPFIGCKKLKSIYLTDESFAKRLVMFECIDSDVIKLS